MPMMLNRTKKMAGVAVLSGITTILLMAGTMISVNTLFLTALSAFLTGFSIYRYGISSGIMQSIVCLLLDLFLNPDKWNFLLYFCFCLYIILAEIIFQKLNKIQEPKKKMRRQLIYNWILFNIIYIPAVILFHALFSAEMKFSGMTWIVILLFAGQIGWLLFDKAYREFFRFLKERKLLKI